MSRSLYRHSRFSNVVKSPSELAHLGLRFILLGEGNMGDCDPGPSSVEYLSCLPIRPEVNLPLGWYSMRYVRIWRIACGSVLLASSAQDHVGLYSSAMP